MRGGGRRGRGGTQGRRPSPTRGLWRTFALAVVLLGLLAYVFRPGRGPGAATEVAPGSAPAGVDRLFLPTGPSDQVVDHAHYSLGYEEAWEQARWVAYRLTPAQLSGRRVGRSDDFRADPAVRSGSATRDDYRRSGYTRGHLAPAGDMAFAERAMSESFLLSNVSPQRAALNGGVWRELEEATRDWVRAKGPTYVVTGPLVGADAGSIGANAVAVPHAFYKVLLTESGEGIGFVVPHARQTEPLGAFARTIDEVELAAGLDFFPELDTLATPAVESRLDPDAWPLNEARYRRRLEHWNHR